MPRECPRPDKCLSSRMLSQVPHSRWGDVGHFWSWSTWLSPTSRPSRPCRGLLLIRVVHCVEPAVCFVGACRVLPIVCVMHRTIGVSAGHFVLILDCGRRDVQFRVVAVVKSLVRRLSTLSRAAASRRRCRIFSSQRGPVWYVGRMSCLLSPRLAW